MTSTHDDVNIPANDTEPDEHGNEPEECELCEMAPQEGGPVITTNRSLFRVGNRLWIEPLCELHDDHDTGEKVTEAIEYGGIDFVTRAISSGVFTKEDALEHLPEEDAQKLEQLI